MRLRTGFAIAVALGTVAFTTGTLGAPDESIGGGREELVLIAQTRTLHASGVRPPSGPGDPGCSDEDHDEATEFGPYANIVLAECGYGKGIASQRSTIEERDIFATGWVYASGCDGGGCNAGGAAESSFEVVFESPVSRWITISGSFSTDGDPNGVYGSRSATMTLTDAAGTTLLEEALSELEGTLDFASPFLLQAGETYTFRVVSGASDGDFSSSADYTAVLSLHNSADVNGDDAVNTLDLLAVLAAWGGSGVPEDVNGDGVVDVMDLLELLGSWGADGIPVGACCVSGVACINADQLWCLGWDGEWTAGEDCAVFECSPVYCEAGGLAYSLGIERVAIGDIDNVSERDFYGDFTELTADMYRNVAAEIIIELEGGGFKTAWIDWNQDGSFNDPGEEYAFGYMESPSARGIITPPPDALAGPTRMRVRALDYAQPSPCGVDLWLGEVEDYTIIVQPWHGEWIGDPWIIESLPFVDAGNTGIYSDFHDEACPYPSENAPDVVYAFTPAVDETVTIALCDSDFDTKLYVYENVVGNLVACNDDGCADTRSVLEGVALTAGNTYYIIVDGHYMASGAYELLVDYTANGACCFWPSGFCMDTTEYLCGQLGGNWQGPGTECATTDCPVP